MSIHRAILAPVMTTMVASACSDPAKPAGPAEPAGTALQVGGQAAVRVTRTADVPGGGIAVECSFAVDAQVRGEYPIVFDSGRVVFTGPATGDTAVSVPLPVSEMVAAWGTGVLNPGDSRGLWTLSAMDGVFSARMTFFYHLQGFGTARSASYQLGCVPPLLGRYVLTSVDGVGIPVQTFSGLINADTLSFAPDLTYTVRGTLNGAPMVSGPHRYSVHSPDSLLLPVIAPELAGGGVRVAGTTVTFHEYGVPGRLWRFDLEGTVPPPPPVAITFSKPLVTFAFTRGGPLPPPDTVQVRTADGRITQPTITGGGVRCELADPTQTCSSTTNLLVGFTQPATPTALVFRFASTDWVPGRYLGWVNISAPGTGTEPYRVDYDITVAAP